jgi:hypothetical protein
MISTFMAKNTEQRRLRDLFLPTYYKAMFDGEYEFIEYGDARANGGVDTIAGGKRIDEKIVDWPKHKDDPYDAYALETMSCTVPGYKRPGWMWTNNVDYLLYCFASKDKLVLACHLIDFRQLRKWFYDQDLEQWPLWVSDEDNRSACRIVPFEELQEAVSCQIAVVGLPGSEPDVVSEEPVQQFRIVIDAAKATPDTIEQIGRILDDAR